MRAAQSVLRDLVRGEQLWTLSLGRALDRMLEVGLSGLGNEVATVWCFLERGVEMVCIARRESERGYVRAEGHLLENDYPAYFAALRNESCVAAEDAMSDPRTRDLVGPYLRPRGVHALLDVSLRQEGRVFGVVCFEQLHEARVWSEAERDFAMELAGTVNQLLLIDELRRRNKLLRMLNGIAPRLGRDHTVQDLARIALDTLREEFGEVWAAFLELEPDGQHCRMLAANARDFPAPMLHRLERFPLAGTLLERALNQRRVLIEALHPGEAYPVDLMHEAVHELGLRGVICIPLEHAGRVLGGVVLWLRENSWLGADAQDAFESITTTVSVAFANAVHLRELRHRARHDELTGLANRDQLFEDLAHHARHGGGVLLALLDLRDFRQINDTLGRGLADRVLVEVSRRIAARAAERGGTVYRLAGAEFGVLLRDCPDGPGVVAGLQAAVAAPLELGGLHLIVLAQCGVARAAAELEPSAVVRSADIALGWAKQAESGLAEYDSARDVAGPRNLELLGELRVALREGALELHYQPKVALDSGAVQGCEALLRWTHPVHGSIPPPRLIAAAETGNLMRDLTLWVAETAIRRVQAFRANGLHVPVAINTSVQNLVDDSFPAALQELLERHGVAPGDLRLEITETVMMRDPERALPVIRRLAAMGLALDIDDFGTGYSSLSYLRQMPLTALKIDRAFVSELLHRREDEVIVTSTVGLAHGLGLKAIAEGVEDAATLARLRELGCNEAQGFHIGRPMPGDAFVAWVRQRGGAAAE